MLTGTVTIGARQWQVNIATVYQELTKGLGGLASLPEGTGMLFDLGSDQTLYVTTAPMLFAIDIVFISADLKVTELAAGVLPGYLVSSSLPGRFFLEINSGEAAGIQPGDSVSIVQTGGQVATQSSDVLAAFIPNLVNSMVFWAAMYMMMAMVGWMREKEIGGTEDKKPLKPPESPFLEVSSRYIYWPPFVRNPDKTARLVKSADDYESTGAKVKPEMVVMLAKDVGLQISQAEAEQFLQIRAQTMVAQMSPQKATQKLSPKSEQAKKLLKHGKFPKRDDALARLDSYEVAEVHDDGDLTITSGDLTYVVTTEGDVFKEAHYSGGYAQSGCFADTSASIQASIARISHYPHLEETFRSALKRVNR